ncbi:LysM peptidoglycan-binding domain-containing protein [Kineothrix sp. MSJ-39]|uniref:LysM peptidoglycan-binding domain-containing protein n=1 Tax=Kineothrix sp. MSJ-39 TaxID=2841533 RepID=UPI001C1026AC|nr:LysM peptidoglycan-binding domain-containing protein [Kineothrix sp. MSJ-39]MBU5430713.1 LysM peptidoglycan-binding domain-containing protein [Kineothrix sp. MSJ-39]
MAEQGKEGMLPKNIRQIGQATGNQKIYLEDYVITYLRQILTPEENMRVMILYGHKEMIEDELYWFVNGAVEAQHDFFMEKTIIDEESWKKVNEMAEKFFPDLTVMGWAITREDSTEDLEEQIMRTQRQFFRPDQKLYFEYITSDKTEALYLHEKGKRNMLSGYYIYYERNECMQNYMVSLRTRERHPEEMNADHAARQFREVCQEKKQDLHKKRSSAFATCASLLLVMAILVIGITMLNNYEKMQSMERVLYQISGKMDDATEATADADTAQDQTVQDALLAENTQAADRTAEMTADAQDMSQTAEAMQTTGADVTAEQADPAMAEQTVDGQAAGQTTDENMTAENQSDNGQAGGEQEVDPNTTTEPSDKPDADITPAADENAAGSDVTENSSADASQPAAETTAQAGASQETVYMIKQGDTLAKICMQYYGNLSKMGEVCERNQIEDKDSIYYGQKIVLP